MTKKSKSTPSRQKQSRKHAPEKASSRRTSTQAPSESRSVAAFVDLEAVTGAQSTFTR